MNLRDIKVTSKPKNTPSRMLQPRLKSSDTKISFKLDEKHPYLQGNSNSNNFDRPNSISLQKEKKKLSKVSKFFLTLFLIVLTIGGSVFGYLYYQSYKTLKETGVENVDPLSPLGNIVGGLGKSEQPLAKLEKTDNRTNFLLIGVDARNGFSSTRTDTMIVASYNHETKQVVEISIPRDIRAKYGSSYVKINAIFPFSFNEFKVKQSEEEALKSSFDRLSESVNDITGLKIHYGVMVNFNAVKDVVNALGGITVDVSEPLVDRTYPNDSDTGVITISFKAGVQTMDGTKALQYARSRHSTSDYDRARRQQVVTNAIKDKFIKSNLFQDIGAVNGLISAVSKNIRFFKVDSKVITELFNGRDVLNQVSIANLVIDPSIGSFAGQLLTSETILPAPGFIIYPSGGKNFYDKPYDKLRDLIKTYLENPYLLNEQAKITTVHTSKARFKDFDLFNDKVIDKKLPFTYIPGQITLAKPTTSITKTPTSTVSTSTPKFVNIYTREDKSKTLDYYKNLLKSSNFEIVMKSKEDLPKELEKYYKEANILIEFN